MIDSQEPRNGTGSAAAIEVHSLSFTYKSAQSSKPTLADVTLTIPARQSVALLGPNGSGKSTLLKLICGLLPMQSGSLRVFGADSVTAMRSRMGIVFQRESLDSQLTVWENLRDSAGLYGIAGAQARTVADAALRKADLTDRRTSRVKTLSRGLARRVDLCRAMLHDPRLVLLDEPTTGLDPIARERFLHLLEILRREQGLTLLMSTHLIDEAERQDRVLFMHEGRIVADDSPAAMRARMGAIRVAVHDPRWQPPNATWHKGIAGFWLALPDARLASAVSAELASSGVAHSVAPPTLADAFELLTGKGLDLNP